MATALAACIGNDKSGVKVMLRVAIDVLHFRGMSERVYVGAPGVQLGLARMMTLGQIQDEAGEVRPPLNGEQMNLEGTKAGIVGSLGKKSDVISILNCENVVGQL